MLSREMLISGYYRIIYFLICLLWLATPGRALAQAHTHTQTNAQPQASAQPNPRGLSKPIQTVQNAPLKKQSVFLLVSNIATGTLTDELIALFQSIGEVRQVRFLRIGTASVEMASADLAQKASAKLNHTQFRGQFIRVQFLPQDRVTRANQVHTVVAGKPVQLRPIHEPTMRTPKRKLLYPTQDLGNSSN